MSPPIEVFDLMLSHGITLACRRNRATRPDVVMLHGFPEAAFVWDGVMLQLDGRVGCVAPNLRGYPGSSAPPHMQDYRAKSLVADLLAAIEALGTPLPLLVAHDWGGALAWNLAATRPDLIRQLLIINAPHPATFLRELRQSAAQQAASAYMNFLCRPDAESLLAERDFARLWPFFGTGAWLSPALREQYRAAWGADGSGLRGPLNYYRASPLRPATVAADTLAGLEWPASLFKVVVPTTVLWGERDQALLPGLLDGLEAWVPDLRLIRVPTASHWIVHEQPQRLGELIAELVEREGRA